MDYDTNLSSSSECNINATISLHSLWIYQLFGDCVVELKQYFAFVIGVTSILLWICVLWP